MNIPIPKLKIIGRGLPAGIEALFSRNGAALYLDVGVAGALGQRRQEERAPAPKVMSARFGIVPTLGLPRGVSLHSRFLSRFFQALYNVKFNDIMITALAGTIENACKYNGNKNLAERGGFEPPVEVLAPTTV